MLPIHGSIFVRAGRAIQRLIGFNTTERAMALQCIYGPGHGAVPVVGRYAPRPGNRGRRLVTFISGARGAKSVGA